MNQLPEGLDGADRSRHGVGSAAGHPIDGEHGSRRRPAQLAREPAFEPEVDPQPLPADQTPAPPLAVGFGAFGEAFRQFTDAERLEFRRAHYACTSFMDAQVGRALDALDRLELRDRR